MKEVSEKVMRERELEKEYLVAGNENLFVILIFTNDFNPEMGWLCRALNASVDSLRETAGILRGYGYLQIIMNYNNPRTQRAEQSSYDGNPRTQRAEQSSYDGKEYLQITPNGKRLVLKIRSKQRTP